ncbi:MAG: cytochrome c biogenesis protein CcsA, partial [Phycisphaerales bacterium]|nr:cytochrome c biogenesis protein CcsA [Phycisphaerales bacterium]
YPLFSVAVILHLASMGSRMWLAGRWPTQNQFESVLGAALLGCMIGWGLEMWKKNGLFGMALSFVGFLAMTACMTAPYMFGNDLGGAISKTAGILQTYWLYIHVNVIIAAYALIGASFALGVVYLVVKSFNRQVVKSLTDIDQANMVLLQMAFWFLGIGIVTGAIWADYSWGRPWGWDPKETFALVTWIIYLVIVHVRLVLPKRKAETTAWLSIAGFAVMMFNWIGVNYFMAGLHSYA